MSLIANVRLYGKTERRNDGITLAAAHYLRGIGDADHLADGTYSAYVDLDSPGEASYSSLDLTGTTADFRAFAQQLLDFADIQEDGETFDHGRA